MVIYIFLLSASFSLEFNILHSRSAVLLVTSGKGLTKCICMDQPECICSLIRTCPVGFLKFKSYFSLFDFALLFFLKVPSV